LEVPYKTAVLGLPGDRADELIRSSAREAAAAFDRIVLREDGDLRGRRPGEMTRIMQSEIGHAAPRVELHAIPDKVEALRWALNHSQPGEMVVVFYDEKRSLISFLQEQCATDLEDVESARQTLRRAWSLPA